MILTSQMKNMKIYKKPIYLPTVERDKKKGSAVLLLTPNYNSSKKLMTNPLLINKLRFESYYLNPDCSFYINGKLAKGKERSEYVSEATYMDLYHNLIEMTAAEKRQLKDSDFGLPKQRKYPIHDKAHVKSAIKFFNYVDPHNEKELAKNIFAAIDRLYDAGERPNIGKNNRLYNHLPDDYYETTMVHESTIKNSKDIYYNMDKFESGEINLCFITGHSGSGKSTMGRNLVTGPDIELYELDDVVWNKEKFSMENFKEYGDLIYSFFNGIGKKYYYTIDDVKTGKIKAIGDKYEELVINDFINYAINYANTHKNKKFIIEGLWLHLFVKPDKLKNYAVCIKGTSAYIGYIRAAKRDSADVEKGIKKAKFFIGRIQNFFKNNLMTELKNEEKDIQKYRDYFSKSTVQEYALLNEPVTKSVKLYHGSTVQGLKYIDPKCVKFVSESAIDEIPNDITEFLKYLRKEYNYGAVKDGKVVKNMGSFDYYTDYKSLSVAEFEKYKVGVCYDFAHYEAIWFKKNGYKYETYYVQVNNEAKDCMSHTFLVFYLPNGKVYRFEPLMNGIEEFSNINELLKDVKEKQLKDWTKESGKDKVLPNTYMQIKYDAASKALEHLNLVDYTKKVTGGRVNLDESTKFILTEASDIIKQYGVYDNNHIYNACVLIKGESKPLRGRSEVLITKGNKVYLDIKKDGTYRLPGGGWEENEDHAISAQREAEEEARLKTKNLQYKGSYIEVFDQPQKWVQKEIPEKDWWYGHYTELYIADYAGEYRGHIDKVDKDDKMLNRGKFYDIDSVYNKLRPEHQAALKKDNIKEDVEDYDDQYYMDLGAKIRYTGQAHQVKMMHEIINPKLYAKILSDLQIELEQAPYLHVEAVDYHGSSACKYHIFRDGQDVTPIIGMEINYRGVIPEGERDKYPDTITMPLYIIDKLYQAVADAVYPKSESTYLATIAADYFTGAKTSFAEYGEYLFNESDGEALFPIDLFATAMKMGYTEAVYDELVNNFSIEPKDLLRNPHQEERYITFNEDYYDVFGIDKDMKFISESAITEEDNTFVLDEAELPTDSYLRIGNTITLFEGATEDAKLRQLLYNERLRQRSDLLPLLKQAKEDMSFIKYAYPDIEKYKNRNIFVDLYYYNELFFKNNTWKSDKGYKLYLELLKRLVNDPRLTKAGYKLRTLFIPVLDWNIGKVQKMWMYKQSINPISIIFNILRNHPEELKDTFGDMDVIFFGRDKYFKMNFSNIENNVQMATKFSMFIKKLIAGEEFEPEDVDTSLDNGSTESIKAGVVDKIEDEKGVDLTKHVADMSKQQKKIDAGENTEYERPGDGYQVADKKTLNTKQAEDIAKEKNLSKTADLSDIADKEAKLDAVADTIDSIAQNATDVDDAMDKMYDSYVKELINDLDDIGRDDTIKIDATRAARMNKLDQQFLASTINNKSVKELLEEEKNKPLRTTSLDIASPNEEWKNMTYMNFDRDYDMDQDIVACFHHFTKVSKPIAIRKLSVVDNSTSEDNLMLYTCEMEDFQGTRFTLKLDIPIMKNNRMRLRGNEKAISSQLYNMPIIKTETDTCQIVTNYQKIFIRTHNTVTGRSHPTAGKLIKALGKYEGKGLKVTYGENQKVCEKYEVPNDYQDIASVISMIETDHYKFYFDQDLLRSEYPNIDDSKGLPAGINKEGKQQTIIYYTMDGVGTFSSMVTGFIINDCPSFRDVYNEAKPSSSGVYSRCSILNTKIPLVIVCAYLEGLQQVLKKANIKYTIKEKLDQETREKINHGTHSSIRFEDGYLVYENTYPACMLLNGLAVSDMTRFSITEMDNKNTYLEIMDMYGGRIKSDGLDNFYDCLVDPITYENLLRYGLPTDFVSILLYANVLLCDNKYIKHVSTTSRRARKAELIAAYAYEALSESYAVYANMVKHNRNKPTMTVKQSAVIDKILANPTSSDTSAINALDDVETTNSFSFKGKAGMNEDRSYTLDKRMYDESMVNVLGMSTAYSANVSITRQGTLNMNLDSSRGYIKQINGDTDKMNAANTLCASEALTPFGTTRDDAPRTLMTFAQTSQHYVITEGSDPLLVTNGADEALIYLTTDKFAHKAKSDGKIIEMTDSYIIVEYQDKTREFISLEDNIEKNSNAGYYISLKLDPAEKIKVGAKVKEGQIIAYNKKSFSNSAGESDNLAYNIGKLAWVAIMNTHNGYEDSGICSERLAKELATKVIEKEDHTIDKDSNVFKIAKIGDHVEPDDALLVWQNPHEEEDANALLRIMGGDQEAVNELGRRTIRSEISGRVADIRIYRTVEIDELSPSLQKIVKVYEAPIKQRKKLLEANGISSKSLPATYKLPPTGKLKKAQEAVFIEFYLEREDIMSVGDKITYYSANKAIIKDIVPTELSPTTDSRPNEIVDAFVSEVSIDKRMVTSTLNYGGLQKLMILFDRYIKRALGIKFDDTTI